MTTHVSFSIEPNQTWNNAWSVQFHEKKPNLPDFSVTEITNSEGGMTVVAHHQVVTIEEWVSQPAMDMVTVTQLAQQAGVTRGYVKAEIRAGRLVASKLGNQLVIAQVEARRWLANPRRGSRKS